MTIKRMMFIRPGETDWNRAGRQQGQVDSPLNALGRRQAEKLASMMRNIGVSALYSSDIRRAAQTTEILAERLGFAPAYDARLRERDVGHWQGLTLAEIREWYPEEFAALTGDVDGFRIPGGESRLEVQKRMKAAVDDMLMRETGETLAVISHTTALKMLLKVLVPGADVQMADLTNSSVTTVERDNAGNWRLVAVDDVLHLEGIEAQAVTEPEDRR
jgi:broad specificity phosphatase PhoE